MLCSMRPILDAAQKGKYAVMAANVLNADSIIAVIAAAEAKRSPIILGLSPAVLPDRGDFKFVAAVAGHLGGLASVPVAVNLDHGKTFEQCACAIADGCTSIMIDRSMLPLEENIKEVAEIVRFAHAADISVEAELGHVGIAANYAADRTAFMTDPQEAARFVQETGVDHLAVAVGTAHGLYPDRFKPEIDFALLAKLREAAGVPLVLHGGSGTGFELLAKAAAEGVCKINIFSEMLYHAAEKVYENKGAPKSEAKLPRVWSAAYREVVEQHIEAFGSAGRA